MAQTVVKHLLFERGRYFYQRRVPKAFVPIIQRKKWRAPLGPDREEAIRKCIAQTEAHDALMERLKDPEQAQEFTTDLRHKRERIYWDKIEAQDNQTRAWIESADLSEDERNEALAEIGEGPWIDAIIAEREAAGAWREVAGWVTEYERILALSNAFEDEAARKELRASGWSHPMDRIEFHEHLEGVFRRYFGSEIVPPSDPEERDDFDAVKMKLERKIARVAPQKDTISDVAERFFVFSDVKSATLRKYRGHIADLIAAVGDIPVAHLSARQLRAHRDSLRSKHKVSTVRAAFTPIAGMLSYAAEEDLVDNSPMAGVKLPIDKRSVDDKKWLPFSPSQMASILSAGADYWGNPIAGVPTERREAFLMVVRVLAFTALRPSEAVRITPDDVSDNAIYVRSGKTASANRVVPIHPEIAEFPDWVRGGGMDTFAKNRKTGEAMTTDGKTSLVRQNFARLLAGQIDPPINDERRALYSLRSTFQNAMRRAGAPLHIRRAILGHAEGGAIRSYDDGPEFEEKQKWVEATDPRR